MNRISSPTADDSQKVVDQKTLAVATAVAELVPPVKQVLRGQKRLLHTLTVGIVIGLIAIASATVWLQSKLRTRLDEMSRRIEDRLEITPKQVQDKVEDVGRRLDEQPRMTIKPADTSDPSSRPTLVISPPIRPRSSDPAAPPAPPAAAIEIPLDLPRKK